MQQFVAICWGFVEHGQPRTDALADFPLDGRVLSVTVVVSLAVLSQDLPHQGTVNSKSKYQHNPQDFTDD